MKWIGSAWLLLALPLLLQAQGRLPADGRIGCYPFDGNVREKGGNRDGTARGIKPAVDRNGNPGKALLLRKEVRQGLATTVNLPVDAGPEKFPEFTLTFWFRPDASNRESDVFSISDNPSGHPERSRGLFLEKNGEVCRLALCCGKDGTLSGPDVVAGRWYFIAAVYDQQNQAARLIVDDEVFAGRALMSNGGKLRFGPFEGGLDECCLFSRVLSLEELEKISGRKISRGTEGYPIEKRYGYKAKQKLEYLASVDLHTRYIVAVSKFLVRDSAGSSNTMAILKKGESFLTDTLVRENYVRLIVPDGRTGYAGISYVNSNAYPESSGYFAHWCRVILQTVFNITLLRSWLLALAFAVILFFVRKKYDRIDWLINRIRKQDPYAEGASKSGGSGNILKRIFPLKRMRWWPLIIGCLLGLMLIGGLFWDAHEFEWFFNEGFSFLPTGYDRPVHWFLYVSVMLSAVLYLVLVIESVVITGPFLAILRLAVLTILIGMALVVTFYLSILVIIIAIVMLFLWILSVARANENFVCPHCSRTFSAQSGSSGTCPYCGGGVRT